MSPLGFVAYANAARQFQVPEGQRERDVASACFGRQHALFGISPALRPIIAD